MVPLSHPQELLDLTEKIPVPSVYEGVATVIGNIAQSEMTYEQVLDFPLRNLQKLADWALAHDNALVQCAYITAVQTVIGRYKEGPDAPGREDTPAGPSATASEGDGMLSPSFVGLRLGEEGAPLPPPTPILISRRPSTCSTASAHVPEPPPVDTYDELARFLDGGVAVLAAVCDKAREAGFARQSSNARGKSGRLSVVGRGPGTPTSTGTAASPTPFFGGGGSAGGEHFYTMLQAYIAKILKKASTYGAVRGSLATPRCVAALCALAQLPDGEVQSNVADVFFSLADVHAHRAVIVAAEVSESLMPSRRGVCVVVFVLVCLSES